MEGRGLVAITDRAQENREYVRTLLKKKQPELAALLEQLEVELPRLRCQETICGSWPADSLSFLILGAVAADQRAQRFQLGVTPS